jgi:signal transduction histidine kinase
VLKRLPVRSRLTLAFAAVMAVVLAATGLFIHERLRSDLDQAINRTLSARAADVAALAQQSDTGLRDARGSRAGSRGIELAQLIDPSGRVIDHTAGVSSRPLIDVAGQAAVRHGTPMIADVRLAGDGPVRLLAERVPAQGEMLIVLVGEPLENRDRAVGDLTHVLALGGPAALVLASIAGYFLIGAALSPVEAMRRRAAAISAASLSDRLPSAGGNDELGRLGHTLNEMLARIHAAVARERAFVSDAGHELRSPLAMLRTELELVAREQPTGGALQSAVDSAVEEIDGLSRLVDDLLLLGRAEEHGLSVRAGRVSALDLLERAADRARRAPAATDKRIVVDAAADTEILVDDALVARAIDNLLANALRHARVEIRLISRVRGACVELHVLDDGSGFAPEFLPRAWDRFARADAARTADGAGLGLAIVRTITEAHGGESHVANRAGGGADAWVCLPTAVARDTIALVAAAPSSSPA